MKTSYDKNKFTSAVVASASSTLEGRANVSQVIDLVSPPTILDWVSDNITNSNFTILFLKHRVKPSHYTLKGREGDHVNLPYQWILEATNDFENWETLHQYNNISSPLAQRKVMTFALTPSNSYRFFRFTQTGPNTETEMARFHCFIVGKVEFYGTLCFDNSFCQTTMPKLIIHWPMLLYTVFII